MVILVVKFSRGGYKIRKILIRVVDLYSSKIQFKRKFVTCLREGANLIGQTIKVQAALIFAAADEEFLMKDVSVLRPLRTFYTL